MIFIKKAKNRAILTWQFFNGLMYHDLAYAKMSEVQLLYQIMENQKTANKIIQALFLSLLVFSNGVQNSSFFR